MMKWRRYFITLACLVPVHSAVTFLLIGRLYTGTPDNLASTAVRIVTAILALPLLLPMVLVDVDGGAFPRWVQFLSFPLNSILWVSAVYLGIVGWKRLFGKKRPN